MGGPGSGGLEAGAEGELGGGRPRGWVERGHKGEFGNLGGWPKAQPNHGDRERGKESNRTSRETK